MKKGTHASQAVLDKKVVAVPGVDSQVREYVELQLVTDGVVSAEFAADLFDAMLVFLVFIATHPGERFVSSQEIDEARHRFMLCSASFVRFGRELGVDYIHHRPHALTNEPPISGGAQRTAAAMLAAGFVVDGRFWLTDARNADCDDDDTDGDVPDEK